MIFETEAASTAPLALRKISTSAAAAVSAHSLNVVMSPTISLQSPVLGPLIKEEGPGKRKSLLGILRSSSHRL